MKHIHVIVCVTTSKVYVSFELFEYDTEIPKYKLFTNGHDFRCFDCIPWGNKNCAYKRVGTLLREWNTTPVIK